MAKKLVAAGPASQQKPAPSALTLTPAPLDKKSGHYERTSGAEKQRENANLRLENDI
jgi:hypothetical protein